MALSDDHKHQNLIPFYVGQHESNRIVSVTDEILHHAQDCNYDMLTAPITNSHYHSRVLTLISAHRSEAVESNNSKNFKERPFPQIPALTYLDTALTPTEAVSQLLLLISPWIDLSSADPLIANISQQVLHQEISYASFCGAVNVIMPGSTSLQGPGLRHYARALLKALNAGPYININVSLDMVEPLGTDRHSILGSLALFAKDQAEKEISQNGAARVDLFSSWDAWNIIRSICRYNARLTVSLVIPHHLPPSSVQSRWFSEPLRLLNFPASSFLRNAKGYPVLSKSQQHLLYRYMRVRPTPWIILGDVGPLPGLEAADLATVVASAAEPTPSEAQKQSKNKTKRPEDLTPHLSYIRHLQTNQPLVPAIERFAAHYQDYLQNPLQPLADNLESITYEVFEKDPVKYERYEYAICRALKDWSRKGTSGSGPDGKIVVAVVGAGRGPLVTRALKAGATAAVPIELWALEKNPNAFVLLQRHNLDDWADSVHLVQSDMRAWRGPCYPTADGAPQQAAVDILVSELLGSFGDNELSPECLDGIQHVMNPTHGISIPAAYTAHLTPIASPKLHANTLARLPLDSEAFQTPYVVMLHAIDYLSVTPPTKPTNSELVSDARAAPQPVVLQAWEFAHPQPLEALAQPENRHNERVASLKFLCREKGTCHGLAGYFETVLYAGESAETKQETNGGGSAAPLTGIADDEGAVELSINPLTIEKKSKDMTSWFPMFFPLKTPLYFPDETELEVTMWRQTDGRKVWYEWVVEAFAAVRDTDSKQRVRLGASELHSSEKNGCLM